MLRAIGAFVLGWIVMSIVVMAGFIAGPAALGVDGVFEPGTYEATATWMAIAMVISLAASFVGGWVAARVGRGRGPVIALAVVMLVTAGLSEVLRVDPPDEVPPRPADQTVLEALTAAGEYAREPLVSRLANPLLGLVGLALGASLALRGGQRRES